MRNSEKGQFLRMRAQKINFSLGINILNKITLALEKHHLLRTSHNKINIAKT